MKNKLFIFCVLLFCQQIILGQSMNERLHRSANLSHARFMNNMMHSKAAVRSYSVSIKSKEKKLKQEAKNYKRLETRLLKNSNTLENKTDLTAKLRSKLEDENKFIENELEYSNYVSEYWKDQIMQDQKNLEKVKTLKSAQNKIK